MGTLVQLKTQTGKCLPALWFWSSMHCCTVHRYFLPSDSSICDRTAPRVDEEHNLLERSPCLFCKWVRSGSSVHYMKQAPWQDLSWRLLRQGIVKVLAVSSLQSCSVLPVLNLEFMGASFVHRYSLTFVTTPNYAFFNSLQPHLHGSG